MTAPADQPSTAALLDGRYLLGECVGRGGMSQVYRAEDVVLGRTVAVKMMRAEADGAAMAPRARMEMALLASLNHPSLVTLFDAHVVPGRPEYLVMEYVEGSTLADRLEEGPMDAEEVAALATELASALHIVHDAGIVHRDIKPSNVLLTPDPLPGRRPRAKLADFGIACLADGERLTSPGVVIGTAAYLSPEQVRGEAATAASDVYALGLLLLEALTGRRAFPQASGIGAVMARLVEAPEVPAWLGWEWTTLLQAMTASAPGQRPTALDVIRAVATLPTDLARPASADHSTAAVAPPLPATPAAMAAALATVPLAVTAADATPAAPAAASTAAFPPAVTVPAAITRTPDDTATDAASAHAVPRRSRTRARARGMRTHTKILIGSALAAAAILGVNAATWVGSTPTSPALVVPAESEPAVPVEADADAEDEAVVASVADEVTSTDTATTGTTAKKAAAKAPPPKAKKGPAKADKAAEKADKAAKKADKAAKKAERDAKKADRDAKKDEKPDKPGKKKPRP